MSQRPSPRLDELCRFARQEFRHSTDHARSLRVVIDRCAESADTAEQLADDLMALFVGNGFLVGRSQGPYFIGHPIGALHFRDELRDKFNQVQHAVAGVLFGYKNVALAAYARRTEHETQDIKLYDVTIPLGRALNDDNYKMLGRRVYFSIAHTMSIATHHPSAAPRR